MCGQQISVMLASFIVNGGHECLLVAAVLCGVSINDHGGQELQQISVVLASMTMVGKSCFVVHCSGVSINENGGQELHTCAVDGDLLDLLAWHRMPEYTLWLGV